MSEPEVTQESNMETDEQQDTEVEEKSDQKEKSPPVEEKSTSEKEDSTPNKEDSTPNKEDSTPNKEDSTPNKEENSEEEDSSLKNKEPSPAEETAVEGEEKADEEMASEVDTKDAQDEPASDEQAPVVNGDHLKDEIKTEVTETEVVKETPQKKKQGRKSSANVVLDGSSIKVPEGWRREVVQRTGGASAGKMDVYYYSPGGKKLRSKVDVRNYCLKNNITVNVEDFMFSQPKGLINAGTPKMTTPKAAKTPKTAKTESPKKRKAKAEEGKEVEPLEKKRKVLFAKSEKEESVINSKSVGKAMNSKQTITPKKAELTRTREKSYKGVGVTKARNPEKSREKLYLKFPFKKR